MRENYDENFSVIFNRYYKSLVIFSCSFTGDLCASEDLVQTVFYKFFRDRRLDSVSPEKVKSYFFTAVRNATLNHIAGKKESCSLDSAPWFSVVLPDEEELYDDAKIARIKEKTAALPPRTREILEDVVLHSMKYREVAEKYSISVNTVKMLLARGLKKLRGELGEKGFMLFIISSMEVQD